MVQLCFRYLLKTVIKIRRQMKKNNFAFEVKDQKYFHTM